MSVSRAASAMTTKWDTTQCCALYSIRNLPPLLAIDGIHNIAHPRLVPVFVYLPCKPQSPCSSAFGHSCISGLPLSKHILAQQARPRRQRAYSTTLASSSLEWCCRRPPPQSAAVHFVTPFPAPACTVDWTQHTAAYSFRFNFHQAQATSPGSRLVSPRLALPCRIPALYRAARV